MHPLRPAARPGRPAAPDFFLQQDLRPDIDAFLNQVEAGSISLHSISLCRSRHFVQGTITDPAEAMFFRVFFDECIIAHLRSVNETVDATTLQEIQ
jgi:hypothetical protein